MTIRDFIKKNLENGNMMSDEQLMSKWLKNKYSIFTRINNPASVSKAGESVRKVISKMRKKGVIKEISRENRYNEYGLRSCQIYFILK